MLVATNETSADVDHLGRISRSLYAEYTNLVVTKKRTDTWISEALIILYRKLDISEVELRRRFCAGL
jgi:hypothetical protein